MSEYTLPEWVKVGAEALLAWGTRGDQIKRVSVTRVTPSGQVVVSDNAGNSRGERRFMARDFQGRKDGTAHKYVGGTFTSGSLDLYPLDHPKAPKLIAQREYALVWKAVQQTMNHLIEAEAYRKQGDSEQYADALIERLAAWRRAKENLRSI